MSIENDRRALDEEFERLRESGRVLRNPGGIGYDVESLPDFFNAVAHLWDAKFADAYDTLHRAVAAQFPATREPLRILDVGCGTGLELAYIFERVPNAQITAMDQAPRMLAELGTKYAARMAQITLLEASCVQWPPNLADFDYVVSILCVHHFPPDTKVGIYRDFHQALKPGGVYVEGDQMTDGPAGAEDHADFEKSVAKRPDGRVGEWNYDITLNFQTNRQLLREAGFSEVERRWRDDWAVLVAR